MSPPPSGESRLPRGGGVGEGGVGAVGRAVEGMRSGAGPGGAERESGSRGGRAAAWGPAAPRTPPGMGPGSGLRQKPHGFNPQTEGGDPSAAVGERRFGQREPSAALGPPWVLPWRRWEESHRPRHHHRPSHAPAASAGPWKKPLVAPHYQLSLCQRVPGNPQQWGERRHTRWNPLRRHKHRPLQKPESISPLWPTSGGPWGEQLVRLRPGGLFLPPSPPPFRGSEERGAERASSSRRHRAPGLSSKTGMSNSEMG